jgi:ATP-dependent RNA helicase DDX19/DBP5
LLKKLLRSRLIEQEKDSIEVERKNPESPLYSVKRFEDLNLKPELLQGLYSMGFSKPSKIQETALPALINDPPQNIIAQSQSGTGKTAAFSLAMLSRIDTNLNYPQV